MSSNLELTKYISSAGIRPSYQRIKIMDYLQANTEHPTADMIYNDLREDITTLSKTTVYNTLNLFVKGGLIAEVKIDGNQVRYDYNTGTHGHFYCKICGEISDFLFQEKKIDMISKHSFKAENVHLYVEGVCKACSTKE
ncbi:MAG: Fur family transcriptional regulator [Bacteroidota bacterium]|nr:Fur family transcriptional regulator [Bacteroidota bacterium]